MHVLVPTLQYTYVYFYRQVKHLIPRMQTHYASEEDSLKGCHQNSVHGASPPVSASLCGNDEIRLVRNEAVPAKFSSWCRVFLFFGCFLTRYHPRNCGGTG